MQFFDFQIICFSFLIIIGVSLIGVFYQTSIQPLQTTQLHLDGIVGSSEPETIKAHLLEIKQNLFLAMDTIASTESDNGIIYKNPVWIYPTESTNFLRIKSDVDSMIVLVDNISIVPKDTSAFHTGMLDINSRSMVLKENIHDAMPYMYGHLQGALSHSVLILGFFGLVQTLWKRQNPPV